MRAVIPGAALVAAVLPLIATEAAAVGNCINPGPPLIVIQGTGGVDVVLIDVAPGDALLLNVNGNPLDSRVEILDPGSGNTILLPPGVPGDRSAQFDVTIPGIHEVTRDALANPSQPALVDLLCIPGTGPGGNNQRFEPNLLDLQTFDPTRGMDRIPGRADFFNTPSGFRVADNNSPLPQDRVFFNYNHFRGSDINGDGFDDIVVNPNQNLIGGPPGTGFDDILVQFADRGSGGFDLSLTSDQLMAQINRRRDAKIAEIAGVAAADGTVFVPGPPPLMTGPLWHFWVSGKLRDSDRGSGAATLSNDEAEVTTGVYFSDLQSGASSGGYLNFRDIDSTIAGQNVDGEAWGAALFHIRPLGYGLLAKVLVFFESGDATATTAAATGSYDFSQWQIEGEITGHYDHGTWWMRPRVNLFYAATDRDGFVDSTGTPIAGGSADTLRLSFGPTFGHRLLTGTPLDPVAPFVVIEGEWDIIDAGSAVVPGGAVLGSDPFNFHLAGGVHTGFAGIGTATLEAGWTGGGGGSDEAAELKGTLNVPLN